jgi:hypothetical protein
MATKGEGRGKGKGKGKGLYYAGTDKEGNEYPAAQEEQEQDEHQDDQWWLGSLYTLARKVPIGGSSVVKPRLEPRCRRRLTQNPFAPLADDGDDDDEDWPTHVPHYPTCDVNVGDAAWPTPGLAAIKDVKVGDAAWPTPGRAAIKNRAAKRTASSKKAKKATWAPLPGVGTRANRVPRVQLSTKERMGGDKAACAVAKDPTKKGRRLATPLSTPVQKSRSRHRRGLRAKWSRALCHEPEVDTRPRMAPGF